MIFYSMLKTIQADKNNRVQDEPAIEVINVGMDASVLAIGPYSEEIAQYLPYEAEKYSKTQKGTQVVVPFLFECVTTKESVELASLLGVEPWNFNTHAVEKENIKWDSLEKFDDWGAEAAKCLLERNFILIYLPNG